MKKILMMIGLLLAVPAYAQERPTGQQFLQSRDARDAADRRGLEGNIAGLLDENAKLTADNSKLTAENAKLKKTMEEATKKKGP